MSVAGYVIATAATAPDLSELKPNQKSESSVIFAADGSRLGYVQSDEIRTQVPWRDMPLEMRQAVIAIEDERFYKHKGVDYSAIVRAGSQEPALGQERAGRLHDHPAARARALHQGPRAQLRAQDPRGQAGLGARAGALQAVDPQELPQRRAVRDHRRAHGDRRRGGGRDLLRQARARPRRSARRRCWPGLPQAPSQYNPFRNPTAALSRRNEVLERMAKNRFITRGAGRRGGRPSRSGSGAALATPAGGSRSSSTTCRSG